MNNLLDIATKNLGRLSFDFPYDVSEWIKDMKMENYHSHTMYSNLTLPDSATTIEDFIFFTKNERNGQCYFSGEHGFQGEWLKCYDICKNKDIRFRYSSEVYWVKDIDPGLKDNTNCHMVIVARNYTAMRKLNYMISRAYEEGFYYRPRIDLNMLFELNPEDVYITSACCAGWNYEDAAEIWYNVWKHFGNSFFLEYQCHNTDKQKDINKKIKRMHQTYGIQTIIGLDTHYINDEDKKKRDNILARKHMHYEDEDGWYMDYPDGHDVYNRLKQQGVLSDEDIIYSMMNTQVFINGCEELTYNNDFKVPVLPELADKTYEERCQILKNLLFEAYSKEPNQSKEREDGINYELSEIVQSGMADYFLSNQKLVNMAVNKYNGKLTTTSRGSASSYYSSKLCGFTTLDRFEAEVPIYPERFITKDRILSSHQCPD